MRFLPRQTAEGAASLVQGKVRRIAAALNDVAVCSEVGTV